MATDTETIEEKEIRDVCRKNWESNPALRAEFAHDFSIYVAFRMADARGQVKILGQKSVKPEGYTLPQVGR